MKFIFYLLCFIPFSSHSSLYIDDNYDLVFEKDGNIAEKYDVFDDVKLSLKSGDVSKDSIYISIRKE
ncbi:hypothetical protein [Actinobacillus equuli]|uniref:hypothetical protein n=1 Tax=Actinobacillus equuli TaxID=718 RepID=UPI0024426A2D|nr:hypothetical protein [Actinobacillus equuli]WGE42563.1 hypothetical protein NYR64_01590 [Actinobacillus equuli subsp. haemolyticus]WGE46909.1 hypothetical protein NYR84_01550 [Actinobacillus equuli subsp. haemolyticus]